MIQTVSKPCEKPQQDLLHLDGDALCLRQTQPHDCGPRALLTSMLQHAMPTGGLSRLSELARADRSSGTSIRDLALAAREVGWNVTGLRCHWWGLQRLGTHCIARLVRQDGRGHFVVVLSVGDGHVVISDPARGVYQCPRTVFELCWRGEILVVDPASDRASNGTTQS